MEVNTVYDASLDAEMDKRSSTEAIRDDSESILVGDKKVGKITSYKYKILIRDKPTLTGQFTREEMDLIYRLYANEGSNLQQRSVSRYFPDIPFQDFKRIIRAFNISKSSSPVAPHIIEEKTIDELVTITFQGKENDYLRKLEQDRAKHAEVKLRELTKENFDLRNSITSAKEIVSGLDLTPSPYQKTIYSKYKKTLIVYLSDMHIGAHNSSEGVYDNPYNEAEITRRLGKVYDKIASFKSLDKIIIMNLGDAVDGMDATTTRKQSTHILPQNMTNKEQSQVFIKVMSNFFSNIQANVPHNYLSFYSVCESNHGGDFEAIIVTALGYLLEAKGVNVHISSRPFDYFEIDNRTIIYTHGKDNNNQFKNLPLTLDQKTELYLNEYILTNKISGDILIVKGDLHQSAMTEGKQFSYKSVSSLFGSSNWISANFGFTKWGCDYSVVEEDGGIVHGIIKD